MSAFCFFLNLIKENNNSNNNYCKKKEEKGIERETKEQVTCKPRIKKD